MSVKFTTEAQTVWNSIPPQMQERLLCNVWCTHCSGVTTISEFTGEVENGDLILRGSCASCGGNVARVVEST